MPADGRPEPALTNLRLPNRRWSPAPLIRGSFALHAAAAIGAVAMPAAWPWYGGAVLANHALLGAIGLWPRSRWLGPNLVRLPAAAAQRRLVALTFDDGPDPDVTPAILDMLDHFGARASFFCIARRAARHPAVVRAMIDRGHDVENHSDRHPWHFACLPLGAQVREIDTAQKRLSDITGRAPRFFRPPMGLRNPMLDPALARFGLQHVSWTRRGFDAVSTDPARILNRLSRGLMPGDILLLHDGQPDRPRRQPPAVLTVLPILLARMRDASIHARSVAGGL